MSESRIQNRIRLFKLNYSIAYYILAELRAILALIIYFVTCTAIQKPACCETGDQFNPHPESHESSLSHSNRLGHEISVTIFIPRENRALFKAKWGERAQPLSEKMAPSIKTLSMFAGDVLQF